MNPSLAPGKGFRTDLNAVMASIFAGNMADLSDAFIIWMRPGSPTWLVDILGDEYGWDQSEDGWGRKATATVTLPDGGEIRTTVIQKSPEDINLDIRHWWQPKE